MENNKSRYINPSLFQDDEMGNNVLEPEKVVCLGLEFPNEEARREYFREELRNKLTELKNIEGFPIGKDEDIINLSDPPYYTACPNPWLNDFVKIWEQEKIILEDKGERNHVFNVNEPFAADVSEGKGEPIYNAHSYHTKVPPKAISRFLSHYTQKGDIVLDAFSGSGMTGVACKNHISVKTNKDIEHRNVILNDLSPAATNLTYNNTAPVNIDLFQKEATRILNLAEEKFSWMFETLDDNTGIKAEVDYYVWSEISSCENCAADLKFSEIAFEDDYKSLKKEIRCPKCGSVINKRKLQPIVDISYDKELGKTQSRPLREISLICYKIKGKKHFKRPGAFDNDIEEKVSHLANSGIPIVEIPDMQMMRVGRMKSSQIKYIHQFYFDKTRYILSYMWNLANSIKDIRIQNLIKYWLDSQFVNLSYRNRYRPNVSFPYNPMTGVFYIPMMSCESNPFVAYKNKLKKILDAFRGINLKDNCAVVTNSSASQIPIESNSIDYIFTDPPFGENIYYSDLNFYIEAWNGVFTNTKAEAIVDKVKNKTIFSYNKLIEDCFKEYYRVLKPGKWITVVFSNTSASIWNGIQNALRAVGFIVANVSSLDKQQGTFQAVNTTTAVTQDLVISCYKPAHELNCISSLDSFDIWEFVTEHLQHLPRFKAIENKAVIISERTPRILFDRLVSYYVQHGFEIPLDSKQFQNEMRLRFIERDGMFFTASQAIEYDDKLSKSNGIVQMNLFIGSELEGIEWLKRELVHPQTYQEVQPKWMKNMIPVKKGDKLPELNDILEENFIKDEEGKWRKPDPEKAADLEIIRSRKLLKEFNVYLEQAQMPKAKRMKDTRLEVLRYGFKECYKQKDFQSIVTIGDHIQESLLQEDEILLQYYDMASSKI